MLIFGMTYYQICMNFLIYSFVGWVIEVAFHAVTLGLVINRGFLNGPVCPVYGFGMLAVFAMVSSISGNANGDAPLGVLFFGGMVLTTAIELVAGWILDKAFHARWWDYRDRPYNFHGYICLEFSIFWGLGVVLVVRVLHPLIAETTTAHIPERIGWPVMALCYAVYLADFILTVLTIRGLNRRLKELDAMRQRMRAPSDAISKVVADNAIRTSAAIGESRVQAALARAELQSTVKERYEQSQRAMKERYEESQRAVKERYEEAQRRKEELWQMLSKSRHFGAGRLLRAFPQLEHREYQEVLSEMKERLRRPGKRAKEQEEPPRQQMGGQ